MSIVVKSHCFLIVKIGMVFFAWCCLLVIAHQFIHEHADLISSLITHPGQKFIAATLSLFTLIYLLIWSLPNLHRPSWHAAFAILIWSTLIVIGHGVTHLGETNAELLLHNLQEMMGWLGFFLLACAYSLFLAMPFVAGVEIGLLIMAIFGVPGVIVAYAGTVIGLNLAFIVGRLLPPAAIYKVLRRLHNQAEEKDFDNFLESLVSRTGWLPTIGNHLLRNRYLTLMVGLNFPGNTVVGGGGGLSLMAGISRKLIHWPYFALVTIFATLPVPLLVLFGLLNFESTVEHSGLFHNFLNKVYELLSPF